MELRDIESTKFVFNEFLHAFCEEFSSLLYRYNDQIKNLSRLNEK